MKYAVKTELRNVLEDGNYFYLAKGSVKCQEALLGDPIYEKQRTPALNMIGEKKRCYVFPFRVSRPE